jgi:hypothetical protein
MIGLLAAVISWLFYSPFLVWTYAIYLLFVAIDALRTTKNLRVSFLSIFAVLLQFTGYGYGFLRSTIYLSLYPNKSVENLFPDLFFK